MKTWIIALAVLVAAAVGTTANAQSSRTGADGPVLFPAGQVAGFAKQVERELAARRAFVAIVGRLGQPADDLPPGVVATHVGFWVYSRIRTADGRTLPGYAAYNLYQRDEDLARSALAVDYPVDFFAGAHALEAWVIVPTPEVQGRLLRVIGSDTYRALHNPRYSAVSNPADRRYQNCTEHTLDVLLAAVLETADPARIKRTAATRFRPTPIRLGLLQRIFAPVFDPGVAFGDHAGPIGTATFTSLAGFMQREGYARDVFTVTFPATATR